MNFTTRLKKLSSTENQTNPKKIHFIQWYSEIPGINLELIRQLYEQLLLLWLIKGWKK